jgi:hypothetical protein
MKIFFVQLFFVFIFFNTASSQTFQKCKATVTAEFNDTPYVLNSDQNLIVLNYTTGEFSFDVPVNSFESEIDSIENTLNTTSAILSYDGNIGVDIFTLTNTQLNTGKYYPMKGILQLNGFSKNVVCQYSVIKLNNNNNNQLRISLMLAFNPVEFGINKYFPKLTKPINFEVVEQILNKVN